MRDNRVAWYVKILVLLVIAYVISPVDIIPDFIPVLGLLDEVILVPIAIALIVRMIPVEVRNECCGRERANGTGLKILGVVIVVFVWVLIAVLIYLAWIKFSTG